MYKIYVVIKREFVNEESCIYKQIFNFVWVKNWIFPQTGREKIA